VSAIIIRFPERSRTPGSLPGLNQTVAEAIALHLVDLDRDLAAALYLVMRDEGRLFDELGNALRQVLGPVVEPAGPFTDAVVRTFEDEEGAL